MTTIVFLSGGGDAPAPVQAATARAPTATKEAIRSLIPSLNWVGPSMRVVLLGVAGSGLGGRALAGGAKAEELQPVLVDAVAGAPGHLSGDGAEPDIADLSGVARSARR